MNDRSRYRRAFSTVPLLAIIALAGIAVLVLRENPTWNGIALGATQAQVVARLGEPAQSFATGTVSNLQYTDMEVWLRNDRVYCITLHGDPAALYAQTCLWFGLPVGNWGGCTDWHYGNTVARLCGDRLMIVAI
jgi:hypothetical protein